MKIGIDISALQGPHRMRGIGSVLLNYLDNIPSEHRKQHSFVLYAQPYNKDSNVDEGDDPTKLFNTKGLNYEVRFFNVSLPQQNNGATHRSKYQQIASILPGQMRLAKKVIRLSRGLLRDMSDLKNFFLGDPRGQDLRGVDIYLQPDQSTPLPRGRIRKALILYDIIPYVLDGDYFTSYHTARVRGRSWPGSVKQGFKRWLYAYKLKINTRRSNILVAISQHTQNDFVKYIGVDQQKITVILLGISNHTTPGSLGKPTLKRYIKTSWGYIGHPYSPPETPFLLFVGGVDRRRKISDLVTAFNHLRAEGRDIKLVFSGDILQGPDNIPIEETRDALLSSSYIDDIVFLGFADNATRDWLYTHALAFVYPSRYEGFGLPVLEAMQYGTPAITYKNSSIYEIAGNAAIYADGALSIKTAVEELMEQPSVIKRYAKLGKSQASKFSWTQTAEALMSLLSEDRRG